MHEVTPQSRRPRIVWGSTNPWVVVGLLWFCGFFNYADRQAVYSVFPLLKSEFHLDNEQLGLLGSAFMLVYAVTSPFSGYTVDLLSRRLLIALGLAFWSLVCAATALSRNFLQLVLFRGAEGLGEAFYFPASMSVLADYHGPRTRSRAMSIHQTSVYMGTAGGAVLAGFLGQEYGWRSPFWALGLAGLAYAAFLGSYLVEPSRESEVKADAPKPKPDGDDFDEWASAPADSASLPQKVARIVTNPAATLLLSVFIGANFVAATFLAWLPLFIFEKFKLELAGSSMISTAWPIASLFGALGGGVAADWAARRSAGGRILIQSLGLILAAPFVFLAGRSQSLAMVIVALIGAGLCKGIYDANIFASLFDVIAPKDRGTAAGLMNTVGWTGGFLAPWVVGKASQTFGLGVAIASTAIVYLLVGLLAWFASRLAVARNRGLRPDSSPS
ncbi:MAG: MFS transporter [Isosphaeraceae bacterium]